jgi:hypothetical protein
VITVELILSRRLKLVCELCSKIPGVSLPLEQCQGSTISGMQIAISLEVADIIVHLLRLFFDHVVLFMYVPEMT